jgi:hypothetical protein
VRQRSEEICMWSGQLQGSVAMPSVCLVHPHPQQLSMPQAACMQRACVHLVGKRMHHILMPACLLLAV